MREFQRAAEKKRRRQLKKEARAKVRARKSPPGCRQRKDGAIAYVWRDEASGALGSSEPFPGMIGATSHPKPFLERLRGRLKAIALWLGAFVSRHFD